MGPLGLPEIILILLIALLIFGPKRLPEIGRTLGKGMAEFRKASNDLKRTINAELALDENDSTLRPRRIDNPVPSLVQAIRPPVEPPAGTVAQFPEPAPAAPIEATAESAASAPLESAASLPEPPASHDPTTPAPPPPIEPA
jgi:TatA/E family protein of Tat protein translocase